MLRFVSLSLLAVSLAGCGGKVVVDLGNTGTGGSNPGDVCGGVDGPTCAADAYCVWDAPGTCGGTGTCQQRPTSCDQTCGVVAICGCDGKQYCNPCEAAAAGADVSTALGTCDEQPPLYAAYALPTDAPRYVIAKTSYGPNQCLFVVVAGFGSGIPGVDVTMGWSVERIGITPNADDCALGAALFPEPPGTITTDVAKGIVKQDNTSFPCSVDVDMAIAFPPGSPSWVPPEEVMQASGLFVQGGACGG